MTPLGIEPQRLFFAGESRSEQVVQAAWDWHRWGLQVAAAAEEEEIRRAKCAEVRAAKLL